LRMAFRVTDDAPTDENAVVGRVAVTTHPRMQDPRELTRRVVAHHQAHVVTKLLERRRLQFGMFDDSTPERPRERDDDPDLHPREPNGRPLRWTGEAGRDPPRHVYHRRC